MGDDIKLARSAAVKFLNTLTDAKDMTLVDFDTEVRVAKYGQQDFPRLVERIRCAQAERLDGDVRRARRVSRRRRGERRAGRSWCCSPTAATRAARFASATCSTLVRASDVTVYSVGFLEHQSGSVRAEQRLRLTQIADETGGEAFFPYAMKQIEEAYDKILTQIRAQYSLGYVSTNTAADGRWRKVEIKVRRPDSKDCACSRARATSPPIASRSTVFGLRSSVTS